MVNLSLNSCRAQRTRLISALKTSGSKGITTLFARQVLDILHPAGRIKELRQLGYEILTVWSVEPTAISRHKVARYILIREPK